jgi:branched-chain amino acid transport system ATP-binding protein
MPSVVLEVDQVSAGYGKTTVLNGLSMTVQARERLAVIGRNGVGKTTLMRTVMGLCPASAGHIRFMGQDITHLGPHQRAALGLGYVPQTRDIFPSLTVEENLLAGLKNRPRVAVQEAYEWFPRLAERKQNGGTQLSGGEQQMLTVARALLGQPRLLLLDEPLEGLAPLIRQELLHAFKRLSESSDLTVVMVEQQVAEALSYAERALVLDRGQVVHQAPAQALLNDTLALERLVGVAIH